MLYQKYKTVFGNRRCKAVKIDMKVIESEESDIDKFQNVLYLYEILLLYKLIIKSSIIIFVKNK